MKKQQHPTENQVFQPIVPAVIIGSADVSTDAIGELLQNLPATTGMAYLYIQHSGANSRRVQAEELQKFTSMPVAEATNNFPLVKDHFYIIPVNDTITVENGLFAIHKNSVEAVATSPLDMFMLMMAEIQPATYIGVLLSGNVPDGFVGLRAIKSAGGFTYVQDSSAAYQTMPKAAISEGVADGVLSPREIAKEIERISRTPELSSLTETHIDNTEAETTETYAETPLAPILHLIKFTIGVDFSNYKENTIRRRILRRSILFKLESIPAYFEYLKNNKNEVYSLYQDLLINVTFFFRDLEAADYLTANILPELLKDKTYQHPLRIWVAACSTGEEAYSIAMLLIELMGDKPVPQSVEIFATDLSEKAIQKARVGTYSMNDLSKVSPTRLQRFFTKLDGHYRINKTIREMCVFAPHNVFKDPPFSRIHLVTCCNLLIYLNSTLQKKILANFHYALQNNGYLLLGKSETTSNAANLFSPVDKKIRIYQKKNDATSRAMFETNYHLPEKVLTESLRREPVVTGTNGEKSLEKTIDNLLVNQFARPAVVITYEMDIVQFRGSTGLFLEPSPGKASLNLIKMARPGLALELRNGVHKAIKSNRRVETSNIEIIFKGNAHQVNFEIFPIADLTNEKLLLVIFDENKSFVAPEKASLTKDRKLKQLEAELLALREDMRSIVEEQEAANEELQSANEEIVSSNEELQSINEELETSKEELESSNEELLTINQELQMRNEQLAESQEYTESIIATIREAVLVLDNALRVKVINQAFYNTFKLREDEIDGKYLFEVNNREWNIAGLKELLEHKLPRYGHITGFEINHFFEGIGEKVLLVNARMINYKTDRVQFILLAFEDITEHRKAERLHEEREAWLRNMSDNVPVMIWVAGTDKNFTYLNKSWLAFTGRGLPKEIGIGWTEGVHKNDLEPTLTAFHESFENKTSFRIEYRMKRFDGQYRWVLNQAVPTFDSEKIFTGYTGSCVEIHDKRTMNAELEEKVEERTHAMEEVNRKLERSNKDLQQFAYVASHDLQEPLRKIITFANRLKEQEGENFPLQSKEYLEKIVTSSNRMRHLIDEVLNYSRIVRPGGGFMLTDLNTIVKNTLANFDLLINEQLASIHFDELPSLQAVPVQMMQLFDNLISNALKFVRPGTQPEISITCRMLTPGDPGEPMQREPGTTYYQIDFKDSGIGFDPAFAEQIFIIFQRLNGVENYKGTGIGLALCRKIVENHSGWITAESNGSNGSMFRVTLPAKQPE